VTKPFSLGFKEKKVARLTGRDAAASAAAAPSMTGTAPNAVPLSRFPTSGIANGGGEGAHAPRDDIAAVKRSVWQRDGGRCAWPIDRGGTCGSTHLLEFDHVVPWVEWSAARAGGSRGARST
jgi:hypothetical protein